MSVRRTLASASSNSRLERQLFSYAAAATAAGVSLLALTPAAEAKISYTAANITIPNGGSVQIDLANEGVPQFNFYFYQYGPRKVVPLGYHEEALSILPENTGNAVWSVPNTKVHECAVALPAGVKVGSGGAFQSKRAVLWASGGSAYSNVTECEFEYRFHGAFLGLKFTLNGQTHYGWAHVTVTRISATIEGYAYETVPNQPIFTGKTSGPIVADLQTPLPAPQPASLGALALGSGGLSIWRRREEEL